MSEAVTITSAVGEGRSKRPEGVDRPLRVAVLIPCLDEEATVGKVVEDFRRALPDARIYVFDNGSTDRTADRARAAGTVRFQLDANQLRCGKSLSNEA